MKKLLLVIVLAAVFMTACTSYMQITPVTAVNSPSPAETALDEIVIEPVKETEETTEGDLLNFYLDSYSGYYMNNSGSMFMTVVIEHIEPDETSPNTWGTVSFWPGETNEKGKTGSYGVEGYLNVNTGEIIMWGTNWISDQPKGYDMLDFVARIEEVTFKGKFYRDYLEDFHLVRHED